MRASPDALRARRDDVRDRANVTFARVEDVKFAADVAARATTELRSSAPEQEHVHRQLTEHAASTARQRQRRHVERRAKASCTAWG
jgi:hypothetical protein